MDNVNDKDGILAKYDGNIVLAEWPPKITDNGNAFMRMLWRNLCAVFSKKELSEILGASAKQLERLSENGFPDCGKRRKIFYLFGVILILCGTYNRDGIRRWFKRKRSQLGDKSSLEIFKGDWSPDDEIAKDIEKLAHWLVHPSAT